MPGDLITADWQMQLDTWTGGGAGDDWHNIPPGWTDPTGGVVVGTESKRTLADGVAAGFDTNGAIMFSASMSTASSWLSPAEAMDALSDLRDVWRASGFTDKELWLQLPGLGVCYLVGRPLAPEVSLELVHSGVVTVLLTFKGTDGVLHLEGS